MLAVDAIYRLFGPFLLAALLFAAGLAGYGLLYLLQRTGWWGERGQH